MQVIWKDATRKIGWLEEENNDGTEYFTYRIYTDYTDHFPDDIIREAFEHKNPKEYLEDKLWQWADEYAIDYGYAEVEKEIKHNMTREDEEITKEFYSEEFFEWIEDNVYFYYDWNDFNDEVRVNIAVDTEDSNEDFSCNSILNYYGLLNEECEIDKHSSIMYLKIGKGDQKINL